MFLFSDFFPKAFERICAKKPIRTQKKSIFPCPHWLFFSCMSFIHFALSQYNPWSYLPHLPGRSYRYWSSDHNSMGHPMSYFAAAASMPEFTDIQYSLVLDLVTTPTTYRSFAFCQELWLLQPQHRIAVMSNKADICFPLLCLIIILIILLSAKPATGTFSCISDIRAVYPGLSYRLYFVLISIPVYRYSVSG